MTQPFYTPHQIASEALWIEAVEVASPQIVVGRTLLEHVVDDLQNRMADSDTSALLAPSRRQTPEARGQEAVFGMTGRLSCQHQRTSQPAIAFGGSATPSLAGTLVVARGHPCPQAQVPLGGKHLHVHP